MIGRSSGGSGPAEVCISILCAEAGKTPLSSPVCHRVNDNSRHFNDLFSIYSKDTESNLPNPASVYNSVYAVSLNCVCMLCVYKRNRHPVRTLWMLPVFHKISCSFILSVLIPHFSEFPFQGMSDTFLNAKYSLHTRFPPQIKAQNKMQTCFCKLKLKANTSDILPTNEIKVT